MKCFPLGVNLFPAHLSVIVKNQVLRFIEEVVFRPVRSADRHNAQGKQ